MKNAMTFLLSSILLFAGCSGLQESASSDVQFEVVKMTPLPPLKPTMVSARLRVNVLIHVLSDGTVEDAKVLGSSGDPEWDALAAQSIKSWQFSIPRRNGQPTSVWARHVLIVHIEEPMVMTLGRVTVSSLREADSLYALLERGIAVSFGQSRETVDIATFPKHVRTVLKSLDENSYTHPIRLGESYIIFKRFPAVRNNI